jgi:hypothetical protein
LALLACDQSSDIVKGDRRVREQHQREFATIAIGEKSLVTSKGTVLFSHLARTAPGSMSSRVYPSGAAFATKLVPMTEPAPGRFSATTACCSFSLQLLGNDARGGVYGATGRNRHHEGNRPR